MRTYMVEVEEVTNVWYGVKADSPAEANALAARGLVKPWTATTPGEELADTLRSLTEELGDYPHEVLEPLPAIKKQSTRMLKLTCKSCGYLVRTTQKWLNLGTPTCQCGTEMEES